MTDLDRPGVSRPVLWAIAALVSGQFVPVATVAAQDTTEVVKIRGLRVEVPRPTATTGGTSAVEVSLDSVVAVAAPTMEEFLRRIPTVQIRSNSRGEAQPDLRGAKDRQIAIFLDGIPVTVGWDHRTDMSVIPLTAVRKMTLYRGLSSMLHGPNVLGGAIEFDVGRGTSLDTNVPPLLASLSVDQEGATGASATVGSRIRQSWVLRSGAGYRDSPGFTLPAGTRDDSRLRADFLGGADGLRLNSHRRLIDGFVAARYDRPEGGWFSSLVTVSDAERGVPPEAHVDNPRLWRYPRQSRLFTALSGGSGMRRTGVGEGRLEVSFGLDRSTTEIAEYASAAYQTVEDGETGTTETLTGRILGDHKFNAGPELWTAVTLATVSHIEDFMSGESFRYRQRLWSVGGELEIASEPIINSGSGQIRWTVGASVDGSDTPRSGDKQPLDPIRDWGVRAGASRTMAGGNVLLHAGFSRRTRFPSLRELYSGALGRFLPNPDLRPESLRAGEAGITINDGGNQLQLVGFHNRLTDGIVRETTVTPGGAKFRRVNRDKVRSTGLEILTAGSLGIFTFSSSFTWQRVRISDPGSPMHDARAEYTPALSGTVSLDAMAPGQVSLDGFLRYRGVQYCQNFERTALDEMKASATVDLEARRTFLRGRNGSGRRMDATVGVANLTDSTVLDQCGLPQPGRTFRIQVNVR